jgi:hypothetical protein
MKRSGIRGYGFARIPVLRTFIRATGLLAEIERSAKCSGFAFMDAVARA